MCCKCLKFIKLGNFSEIPQLFVNCCICKVVFFGCKDSEKVCKVYKVFVPVRRGLLDSLRSLARTTPLGK